MSENRRSQGRRVIFLTHTLWISAEPKDQDMLLMMLLSLCQSTDAQHSATEQHGV